MSICQDLQHLDLFRYTNFDLNNEDYNHSNHKKKYDVYSAPLLTSF